MAIAKRNKKVAKRGICFNKVSSHLESGEVLNYYGLKGNKITQVEIEGIHPIYIKRMSDNTFEIVSPSFTNLTLLQLENNVITFKMNTDWGLKGAFQDADIAKKASNKPKNRVLYGV